MNNKEKYIKSIDNLKADEYLKAKTLKELNQTRRKSPYMKIINVAVAAVFVLSCIWIVSNQDKSVDSSIYKNQEIIQLSKGIKTVENFEQLKGLIETKENETSGIENDMLSQENTLEETKTTYTDREYSTTNVQVTGVDEADIVKTDGEYIYYAGDSKKIKIIDANEQELVSEIQLYNEDEEGGSQQIYINDDKLVVISSKYVTTTVTCGIEDVITSNQAFSTDIYEYNVSDKNNIVQEKSVSLAGDYLNSRMIGDIVYVITNQYVYKNDESKEEDLLPYYIEDNTENKQFIPYEYIYYEEENKNNSYINIMSVNLEGETQVKSFLGSGSKVYVSEKNIYITKTKQNETVDQEKGIVSVTLGDAVTKIYKFGINNGKITLKETSEAPGYLLNQFSMDEYDGYFRIATSSTEDGKKSNNIYVFDARLNKAGELTNIAVDENIYAVRFMGEKAYVVTFKQVDPLFVIDLSNQKEPKILGELKVPGFSNYLHVYDETHLIGIGQNTVTDENGNTKTQGVKVSLFDVTNATEPVEVSNIVLGESGAYSAALYNHKAVLFIKEKGILAFPLTIYKNNQNSEAFNGIEVLQISLEEGIQEKGRIRGESSKEYEESIDRVIYIEDKLFSINNKQIIINNIETMQEINRVNI